MKQVYIAFYDGRVAGCFSTMERCTEFIQKRLDDGREYYNATLKTPTRVEFDDELGNPHAYWWDYYDVD